MERWCQLEHRGLSQVAHDQQIESNRTKQAALKRSQPEQGHYSKRLPLSPGHQREGGQLQRAPILAARPARGNTAAAFLEWQQTSSAASRGAPRLSPH